MKTKYNVSTGQFLGLIESIGQIVVRGDSNEVLFDYGCNDKKNKLLPSVRKAKIPNSFHGGMFSWHKEQLERGKLGADFSRCIFACVLQLTAPRK